MASDLVATVTARQLFDNRNNANYPLSKAFTAWLAKKECDKPTIRQARKFLAQYPQLRGVIRVAA